MWSEISVHIIPSKKNSGGIFFDGIHETEYGIPAEFRTNSVSTEYEIPQNGIPYSAEFRENKEFRYIRNSVKMRNSVQTEFHNLIPAEFREKIPQNSGGIPYHGIPLDISPSELRVICTKGQLDYIEGLGWYAFLGGENGCRPDEL